MEAILLKKHHIKRQHFIGLGTLKVFAAVLDEPLKKEFNKLKDIESREARRVEELRATPHKNILLTDHSPRLGEKKTQTGQAKCRQVLAGLLCRKEMKRFLCGYKGGGGTEDVGRQQGKTFQLVSNESF